MAGRPAGMSDDEEDDEWGRDMFSAVAPLSTSDRPNDFTKYSSDESSESDSDEDNHWPHVWETAKAKRGLDIVRAAIIEGNTEKIKEEISKGMSPDEVFSNGWSLLTFACKRAELDVVRLLLESGADPDLSKSGGFTALMALCVSSSSGDDVILPCARLLLDKKTNVNAKNRHKFTALMLACRDGRETLVDLLLSNGANPNIQNSWGWTALMFAAGNAHGSIIHSLLEHGADLTLINQSGDTAAGVTRISGYEKLTVILENIETGSGLLKSKLLDETICKSQQLSTTELEEDRSAKLFSEMELQLMGMDLNEYAPVFEKHHVDMQSFILLTEQDLINMGIKEVGVRKVMIEAIKEMHATKWEKKTLSGVHYSNSLSAPEIAAVMANIAYYLRFIQNTSWYLLREIKSRPDCLELGKDVVKVSDIKAHISDGMVNSSALVKELTRLHQHLSKIEGNTEYQVVGRISKEKKKFVNWKQNTLCAFVLLLTYGVVRWTRIHTVFFQLG